MSTNSPDHTKTENCIDVFEPCFFVLRFGVTGCVSDEVFQIVANVSYNLNRIAGQLLLMSKRFKTSQSLFKKLIKKIIQQIYCFLRKKWRLLSLFQQENLEPLNLIGFPSQIRRCCVHHSTTTNSGWTRYSKILNFKYKSHFLSQLYTFSTCQTQRHVIV